MKESIMRKRQAASVASVGSTCDLNLKIPGAKKHTVIILGMISHQTSLAYHCILMSVFW